MPGLISIFVPIFGKLAMWLAEKFISDAAERERTRQAIRAGMAELSRKNRTQTTEISEQWKTIKESDKEREK